MEFRSLLEESETRVSLHDVLNERNQILRNNRASQTSRCDPNKFASRVVMRVRHSAIKYVVSGRLIKIVKKKKIYFCEKL